MLNVKSVLKEFGLTENEAETYLILLRLGSASASDILAKTGIHRINLYDILERLQEKGLVSYVIMGKRKHYEATDPKKILEIEEERKNKIKGIISELESQRQLSKSPQEATIYKDKQGIKNVISEVTKSKTEVYLFASGWGFKENFPDYYDTWYSHLKLNKIKVKHLISSKFRGRKQTSESFFENRYLPSEFVFPSTTVIFEDKVLLLMWSKQPIAILIRGEEISDSYKKFFEILWNASKK
ncbi:MAG: helix-turn-helix domain-containing protein [Candidatus Pacearchaeota archaeon]|jgi:sugar-specific transcriptional regulator TrmB